MRVVTGRKFLLGGRSYPLRLDYFKFKEPRGMVRLEWKIPRGELQVLGTPHLSPAPAARSGRLRTKEQISTQAQRLMADPRAKAKLVGFFERWLKLDVETDMWKEAEMFPGFDAAQVAEDLSARCSKPSSNKTPPFTARNSDQPSRLSG